MKSTDGDDVPSSALVCVVDRASRASVVAEALETDTFHGPPTTAIRSHYAICHRANSPLLSSRSLNHCRLVALWAMAHMGAVMAGNLLREEYRFRVSSRGYRIRWAMGSPGRARCSGTSMETRIRTSWAAVAAALFIGRERWDLDPGTWTRWVCARRTCRGKLHWCEWCLALLLLKSGWGSRRGLC